MELSKDEIQRLLFCIDLVIQNFGDNEELERIYDKLIEMKDKKQVNKSEYSESEK